VVHHGQGLAFRLEASDDLGAIHAWLDDLQGHAAADRLLLIGHVDNAHAALADLLQELVAANARARSFSKRVGGCQTLVGTGEKGFPAGLAMGLQEGLHALPENSVPSTGLVEKGSAFQGGLGEDESEKRFQRIRFGIHGKISGWSGSILSCDVGPRRASFFFCHFAGPDKIEEPGPRVSPPTVGGGSRDAKTGGSVFDR
jgi:hypothetical protein